MIINSHQLTDFAKQDGPILYVSLGSMFSQYTSLVQRLVNILATMPEYRYIVSLGPRGDQIKLPDNGRFYGENYINQLVRRNPPPILLSIGRFSFLRSGIKLIHIFKHKGSLADRRWHDLPWRQ